ncbi:unnamed protein product [Closterium sp. NIES-53]
MEVAHTSMIHAAAPHFLWPFAVRYAAHQLNLWPRVSLPETSPTLRWTGKVGDASVFRVWGSRAFVCDTSADKLYSHAISYVFLGFPLDAPGWQFYHPTSCRVLPSQDVTFDESVPFYHPLPLAELVEVTLESGAAKDGAARGTSSGFAEHAGAEPGGAEPKGAEPGGAETEGAEPGGAMSESVESGVAKPRGTASAGGSAGASPRQSRWWEPLLPRQLRKWFARRARLSSGAARAGGPAAGGAGARGAGATSPGGARTSAGGAGAGGTGAGDHGAGGTRAGDPGAGGAGAGVGGTGASTLELEALELEALALKALELETLELEALELEVLELEELELEALELEALELETLELEVLALGV